MWSFQVSRDTVHWVMSHTYPSRYHDLIAFLMRGDVVFIDNRPNPNMSFVECRNYTSLREVYWKVPNQLHRKVVTQLPFPISCSIKARTAELLFDGLAAEWITTDPPIPEILPHFPRRDRFSFSRPAMTRLRNLSNAKYLSYTQIAEELSTFSYSRNPEFWIPPDGSIVLPLMRDNALELNLSASAIERLRALTAEFKIIGRYKSVHPVNHALEAILLGAILPDNQEYKIFLANESDQWPLHPKQKRKRKRILELPERTE